MLKQRFSAFFFKMARKMYMVKNLKYIQLSTSLSHFINTHTHTHTHMHTHTHALVVRVTLLPLYRDLKHSGLDTKRLGYESYTLGHPELAIRVLATVTIIQGP